jgi:hypothetical protein
MFAFVECLLVRLNGMNVAGQCSFVFISCSQLSEVLLNVKWKESVQHIGLDSQCPEN